MSPYPTHDQSQEQPLIQPAGRADHSLSHEIWNRYGLAPGLIAQKCLMGLGSKVASPINRNSSFLGDIQKRWRTNNAEGNSGQVLFRYAMAPSMANDPSMKEPTVVVPQAPKQTVTATVQRKEGMKDVATARTANGIQKDTTPKQVFLQNEKSSMLADASAPVVKTSARTQKEPHLRMAEPRIGNVGSKTTSKNISTTEKQGHSPLSFSVQRKTEKERVSPEMSPTLLDSAKQGKRIDSVARILHSGLVVSKKNVPAFIQRQTAKSPSQEVPSRATASARVSDGDSPTIEMQPPLFLARTHRRLFTESDLQGESTGVHGQGHNRSMPPLMDQVSGNVSSPSVLIKKQDHEVHNSALTRVQPKVEGVSSVVGSHHHEVSPKLVLQRQVATSSVSGKPPALFSKREIEESSLPNFHISQPQGKSAVESRKKFLEADRGQMSMLPPAVQTKGDLTGESTQSGTRAFLSGAPSHSKTSLVFRSPLGDIREGIAPLQSTTTNNELHRSELPEMRATEHVDFRSESTPSDFIDVDDLTEQVWEKLSRRFRIARERQGRNIWL